MLWFVVVIPKVLLLRLGSLSSFPAIPTLYLQTRTTLASPLAHTRPAHHFRWCRLSSPRTTESELVTLSNSGAVLLPSMASSSWALSSLPKQVVLLVLYHELVNSKIKGPSISHHYGVHIFYSQMICNSDFLVSFPFSPNLFEFRLAAST